MPLQATSGAASQDAFGGNGVAVVPTYIEDVFSTWLYTGTGASQTITNGIDLSTKGGFVWIKDRTSALDHMLFDTARGADYTLRSNTTDPQYSQPGRLSTFNTDGFSIGNGNAYTNGSGDNYVSWTFRKQPKFFDVVTYTGNGTAGRQIAHSLGSTPGCIMIKVTSTTGNWVVLHRSTSTAYQKPLQLNTTAAEGTLNTDFAATSTTFSVSNGSTNNANGDTYVAYLFAHDAGGFGLTGTDNVISCGSVTANSTGNATATLGFEPQFILLKSTSTGDWYLMDQMRGWTAVGSSDAFLRANNAFAEGSTPFMSPTSTGFTLDAWVANETFIYIAIRRGPMKVPTTGTSVFTPVNQTGNGTVTTNFPVDLLISTTPSLSSYRSVNDRLRGASTTKDIPLYTNITDAEAVGTGYGFGFDNNTGFKDGVYSNSFTDLYLSLRRAPSFMDVVCYTGTGSATTFSHNLQAVPELMIVKRRDTSAAWDSYCSALANTEYIVLNTTAAKATGATRWNSTTPTSSVFSVGTSTTTNASAGTYVAYLFATCAGVSKVGSYTGTATTKQIDCGFTGGARFILIKRTDSTGDWYVWDTARGIVSGNDSYFLLNSDAVAVTNTDYIDTYSAGFEISSTAPAAINASGGNFVFLAIA